MTELKGFKLLKKGDTIAVIASSSPSEKARFERGVAAIESYGFRVRVALSPYLRYQDYSYLYSSDSAINRGASIEQLFCDAQVKAVLAVRGGYGSMELLPLINWSKLAKHRKPLIGLSDTTALLNALVLKSKMLAVHGPALESGFSKLAESAEAKQSVEALVALLTEGDLSTTEKLTLHSVSGGERADGILVGGNLSMISALLGTPWEIPLKGKILFLEETDEKPYRIHRMLLQMKLAGRFKGLKAVVLGSFTKCEHQNNVGPSLDQVIIDIFKDCKFPVARGLQSGHQALNYPLLFGANVRLFRNKLEFMRRASLFS